MASKLVSLFLLLLLHFLPLKSYCLNPPQSWIKAGYYYSGSETVISDINSKLFTHLLCAFAYINSSTYHLSINSSTEQKFSTFTDTVKRNNPLVTTLLSIYMGWQRRLFNLLFNDKPVLLQKNFYSLLYRNSEVLWFSWSRLFWGSTKQKLGHDQFRYPFERVANCCGF
jgi:hypothetical protein